MTDQVTASLTVSLKLVVKLGLFDFQAYLPVKDRYFVHIDQNIVGSHGEQVICYVTVDELLASDKVAERLRRDAIKLVAAATGTKPSQWNAKIRDHLGIEVTRKGTKK